MKVMKHGETYGKTYLLILLPAKRVVDPVVLLDLFGAVFSARLLPWTSRRAVH